MAGDEPSTGAEQLQAAALGMIAAGRAVLDAVESLLRDPVTANQVTDTLSQMARGVVEVLARSGREPSATSSTEAELERIEVS